MEVRPATPEDGPALAAVARRSITITGASLYDEDQIAAWSASFSPEAFEQLAVTQLVFVVDADGDIAGFSSLLIREDGRAEVDLLYVDPSFSRRGAARLAVRAVESAARTRGVTSLWADASRLAAPVFEHLGYEVVERYMKERGDLSFPNTWLVKRLGRG
jgi:putative acetyltransferase